MDNYKTELVTLLAASTGCSEKTATDYLIAEEWDYDDAAVSLCGDLRKEITKANSIIEELNNEVIRLSMPCSLTTDN